jgi:hypothetical protein
MTQLNGGRHTGQHTGRHTGRRLTVAQAADALGVTVDAIRSRIKRGSIVHVREDGRVYVVLGDDQGATSTDQGSDQGGAQYADHHDDLRNNRNNITEFDPRDELIATLKEQLEAERNAHAETRRIAYALAQRVPELEAPPAPREAPQTAAEEPEGSEPHPATGGAQEAAQPRPWWRRWLG